MQIDTTIPSSLDLLFERVTPLTPEKLWKGWTDPDILMKWFTPRPWTVSDCKIDLRPGGQFYTLMRSPEGQEFPNMGCYLDVIPNKKLVWTNMLEPGFRPASLGEGGFGMTVKVMIETTNLGTLYKALVLHKDEQGRRAHEQMGFQEGWGKAFDQLVELMK